MGLMDGQYYGQGVNEFAKNLMGFWMAGMDRKARAEQAAKDEAFRQSQFGLQQKQYQDQLDQTQQRALADLAQQNQATAQRRAANFMYENPALAAPGAQAGGLLGDLAFTPQGRSPVDLSLVGPGMRSEIYKATQPTQTKWKLNKGVDANGRPTFFFSDDQGNVRPFDNKFKPEAQQPGVVVNTGSQAPRYGTIPQGYMLKETPEGAVMVPVPGGPAEREIQKEQQTKEMGKESAQRYQDIVIQDVDRVIDKITGSKIPVTGIFSKAAAIPGTEAHDIAGLIDTIRANVGFDRLQQMRDSSPTGGALGQVSELENKLMQATLGNLAMSQTEEQLVQNLRRVQNIYLGIVNGWAGDQAQAGASGSWQAKPKRKPLSAFGGM